MLLDILYYDQMEEPKTNEELSDLSIGPFHFSREQVCYSFVFFETFFFIIFNQVGVGIISDLLLFISSLFLVRRIRRHRSLFRSSSILQVVSQLRPTEVLTTSHIERRNKKSAKSFPWWCLFIAYDLSFLMIIVSILLILRNDIKFGDVKVQKWLGLLIISFISSVLLTQPIKVCILSG